MEWIFERESEELVGALKFENHCTSDSFVGAIAVRNKSSSIEKSWPNFISLKIFLNSTFFEVPSHDFDNLIRFISDFNLMQAVAWPIVTLSNVSRVEVVLNVVVMTEIVGWVDKRSGHVLVSKYNYTISIKIYAFQ